MAWSVSDLTAKCAKDDELKWNLLEFAFSGRRIETSHQNTPSLVSGLSIAPRSTCCPENYAEDRKNDNSDCVSQFPIVKHRYCFRPPTHLHLLCITRLHRDVFVSRNVAH